MRTTSSFCRMKRRGGGDEAGLQRKWDLLQASFPSQHGRAWWDREVVAGLARLRGVEARTRYAEGFTCSRAVLRLG